MPVATHPSTLETPEFRLLNSYGSIDNISLASRLCSAVTNAAETNQSEDDIEQLLWRLWNAVLAVASKTAPAEQGKLAQLLQQMAKQGTLKNGDGKEVSVWDKKVWDDLPVFGAAAREVFNNDDLKESEEQTQWININAFLARLTAENAESSPEGSLDFSLYGIWALRDALEGVENIWVPSYKKDTAKVWIERAGLTMRKLSEQQRQFQGKMAAPGEGYSSKEWKGYNNERWEAWNSRLQNV